MRAGQIADAVEAKLRLQHERVRTVYRREWSIGVGATRVDVAAINGTISGCEVKSAVDNFARLESQVPLYSAVLDTAILAVEGAAAVRRASDALPGWWGIWQACDTGRGAALEVVRSPADNPAPEPFAIAQLLWRDEALQALDRLGMAAGLRKATRWRLWRQLAEQLSLEDLRAEVRAAIKARPDW
jgi:hypothetical protein